MTIVVVISWVPSIDPIKDAGIKGQFRFLTHPGPWLILLAVFFGNSGIFCWWSYVSPWLQKTGGWSATMVPMLMVLAGLGMVVGGIIGGLGPALSDLISGYPQWAIFTFIIDGLQAVLVGLLVREFKPANVVIGSLVAGVWKVFGYFIAGGILSGLGGR